MSPAQAATALFGDALSCVTELPVDYHPSALDSGSLERAIEHAELVLRSLALIEEAPHEESEEHPAERIHWQRLEAKLNLVLESLATLLRRERSDLPQGVLRWSRHGAELLTDRNPVPERGFLRMQPLAWLPQRLELPVVRLAQEAAGDGQSRVWLRFDPLPPTLEQALERHLFRLHRRQLAHRKT